MAKARRRWQVYRRFVRNNRAVSALEYAILVGVIAVGIGAALTAFSNQIKAALQNVSKNIAGMQGLTGTTTGGTTTGGTTTGGTTTGGTTTGGTTTGGTTTG